MPSLLAQGQTRLQNLLEAMLQKQPTIPSLLLVDLDRERVLSLLQTKLIGRTSKEVGSTSDELGVSGRMDPSALTIVSMESGGIIMVRWILVCRRYSRVELSHLPQCIPMNLAHNQSCFHPYSLPSVREAAELWIDLISSWGLRSIPSLNQKVWIEGETFGIVDTNGPEKPPTDNS
jgi:hypothetical protein